jgi:hypothetical protein
MELFFISGAIVEEFPSTTLLTIFLEAVDVVVAVKQFPG